MSSDENLSDYDPGDDSSDSDASFHETLTKLQPYDFEPLASSSSRSYQIHNIVLRIQM